jgi:hypothetical protein
MNEKYHYTGPNNMTCPVCKKRFEIGPPVIIFLSTAKYLEQRWCVSCFNTIQREWVAAGTEIRIGQFFLPKLTKTVKHLIPLDHTVGGCWFATVPNQGITLVMEVIDAYS